MILPLIAWFASACNENVDEGTVWDNPNFVRITVTSEPMKTTDGNSQISWSRTDSLLVFDENNAGFKLGTTDNGAKAIFYSHKWGGNRPRYAVFSTGSDDITCTSDGILSVMLDNVQQVGTLNSYAEDAIISVGKINGNKTAYKINPMKNLSGLIKVAMSDSTAKSITVEAIGGEFMTGYVDVDYARLERADEEFWTATPGKAQSSSVTIAPVSGSDAETLDGCLKTGSYYISVLPQFYAKGLRITVDYGNGNTLVRTLGETDGITIPRSDFNAFDGTLDDTLPDVITIELSFYNENDENPLGAFVPVADQNVAGEEYSYTYNYMLDDAPASKDFIFTISKGKNSATYQHYKASGLDHNVLLFGAKNNAWIKLPGIPGRYLKSVSMSHGNTTAKRFRVQENPQSPVGKYFSSPLLKAPSLTTPVTETVTFPTTATQDAQIINTIEGKSYTMEFTEGASLRVFDITVVYSKTLGD